VPDVIPPGGIPEQQSEEPAGIESACLADAAPDETPITCPITVHIAATHHHIRGFKQREQAWQACRIVGEVGIHLDDDVIASRLFGFSQFAEAGGLMSYGASGLRMWRRTAYCVDCILKGAKPSELPVEQPTQFELVIKLKTAKALGLTIPPTLLFLADEVIR